jgi:hypothetical protein
MSTSTPTPSLPNHRTHRNHRHTRSAALPPPLAAPQNPQNPHHLNLQEHDRNSEFGMDQRPQPSTPPRTPRKTDYNSSTNYNPQLSGSESVSKPKSKSKGRPKSVASTPAVLRNDGSISSLASVQSGASSTSARPISTPSAPAYAGATFHASPAPSSLPIPSFYSKSVPDSPGMNGFQIRKEQTSSEDDESPIPPAAQIPLAKPHREESPLDIFFKADREEKARARSASSFHGTGSNSGPFSPPSDPTQPNLKTPSTGSQSRDRNTHFSGGSTSALFAMELDGTNSPGKPIGPAFSTPYNERINAARSSAALQPSTPPTLQEQQQSKSEALKAFLFSGQTQGPPASQLDGSPRARRSSPAQSAPDVVSRNISGAYNGQGSGAFPSRQSHTSFPHTHNSAASRNSPRGGARSSGLRQEVTPTATPQQTPERGVSSYTPPFNPSHVSGQCSPSISRHLDSNSPSASYSATSSFDSTSKNRSADLKGMEDSLRRLLNIAPISNADNRGAGIANMPAASVSVPDYVGGRPPPMNGLHNGVMGSRCAYD